MATTYLTGSAWAAVEGAQNEIDRHVAAGIDGRCLDCRELEPCLSRRDAHAVLARTNSLPLRRPGLASRGVADSPRFHWFADA